MVLAGCLTCLPVLAESIKVLIQDSPLAGFQYHAAPALWTELKEGDALTLVREPNNPHDARAVRIDWRGQPLGYLPRAENAQVAAEMDQGVKLVARIARLTSHPNPWKRIRVAVFVVL